MLRTAVMSTVEQTDQPSSETSLSWLTGLLQFSPPFHLLLFSTFLSRSMQDERLATLTLHTSSLSCLGQPSSPWPLQPWVLGHPSPHLLWPGGQEPAASRCLNGRMLGRELDLDHDSLTTAQNYVVTLMTIYYEHHFFLVIVKKYKNWKYFSLWELKWNI